MPKPLSDYHWLPFRVSVVFYKFIACKTLEQHTRPLIPCYLKMTQFQQGRISLLDFMIARTSVFYNPLRVIFCILVFVQSKKAECDIVPNKPCLKIAETGCVCLNLGCTEINLKHVYGHVCRVPVK